MKKKQIAILGSTGSIGTQALQVIEEHPDLYEAYVLTANNKVDLLIEQARKFMPDGTSCRTSSDSTTTSFSAPYSSPKARLPTS